MNRQRNGPIAIWFLSGNIVLINVRGQARLPPSLRLNICCIRRRWKPIVHNVAKRRRLNLTFVVNSKAAFVLFDPRRAPGAWGIK
ncbi:hypothetical protein [Bradyrhizobium sp.]|jgi:hypothetical protein|uniref:hypothetical protein n=1 Tax=Bradyrhizobium sp. TaxID=376 RepID=UPI002DDD970C|nr:hypothetical protein [Bradyrhizobium sp.]HEV2154754.1 hypothetical protein [Bradyrhizobium sp.]